MMMPPGYGRVTQSPPQCRARRHDEMWRRELGAARWFEGGRKLVGPIITLVACCVSWPHLGGVRTNGGCFSLVARKYTWVFRQVKRPPRRMTVASHRCGLYSLSVSAPTWMIACIQGWIQH